MAEPEAVGVVFACGPGICDMDVSTLQGEAPRIFVGGGEGMLKVLDPKDLENVVNEFNLDAEDTGDEGFAVTAVAVSTDGKELAVGLRNGNVQLYELPSLAFKSMLTRFTAPVLGLHYGMKDGGVIAACSEEPGIRVLRRSNNKSVLTLDDHDGGSKSVAWDPKGEFLAAAGFDGTVKVWKVDPSLDSLLTDVVWTEKYFDKEAPGGGSGAEGFVHLGKVAWHPEGNSLCVTGSSDPLILKRETWERGMIVPEKVEEGGHVKEITVAAFSPDGRHLATAALDGRLVVWHVEESTAVKMCVNTEDDGWRHLQWLDGSSLAALSIGGSVCAVEDAVPVVEPKGATGRRSSPEAEKGEEGDARAGGEEETSRGKRGSSSSKHLFDEEAAEDNGEVSDAGTAAMDGEVDNVAVGDITADMEVSAVGGGRGEGDGGGVVAGDGDGDGGDFLGVIGSEEEAAAAAAEAEAAAAAAAAAAPQALPLQDPFQPSSTPIGDARRYLCWNGVGTIMSVDEGTHNAVEIEFADKAAGRNQRFMDTWNFVMGSLSPSGAIFASVAQEEDETSYEPSPSGGRSVVYYKALGRRSSGGEWTRMMPKGESALAVAAGRGWSAVVTDRQLVRLFTGSGLQGETVMLPGPIVTMVGGGDLLAVVFHKGEPLGDSQNLGYQLLDVGGKRELSKGSVCMSPTAELTWLGMSEERMLVAMDSSGLVLGLTQSFGWQWTPLLDTLTVSKNKEDRFWPVGVVTGRLLAATLKGGEEHPAARLRPVLTSVPLSALSAPSQDGEEMSKFEKAFPAMQARTRQRRFNLENGLAEEDADMQGMEAELMSQQAQLDTMAVKRIQEACAAENPERAMDLASLLNLEKSFTIAIKVANHHGLTSLAASMEDAMIAKFRADDGGEDEEDEEDAEAFEDRGWMRGGGSRSGGGVSGGGGGGRGGDGGEGETLGPLDRARLEAARARSKREVVAAPPRPPRSAAGEQAAFSDGDRSDCGADDSLETPGGVVAADSDAAGEIEDSEDEGHAAPTAAAAEKSAGPLKRLKRRKGQESAGEDDGVEQQEEEEELVEMSASAAPRNPFARGKTFSSPPRKKKKDILETMNDLRASPSPVAKRPALTRLSSFAAEARTKNRNDRNIL